MQKKLHEELDAVLGDSDGPLDNDQLRDLKYLECCIKEALRLFPSVPIFARASDQDTVICETTNPYNKTKLIMYTSNIR